MKGVILVVPLLLLLCGTSCAAFQKGMSYLTWGTPALDSALSKESLVSLKSTGTEWIALVNTWYQKTIDSTTIEPASNSYTDTQLANFLTMANSVGLKVLLKPHVDPQDGQWRAWIGTNFTAAQWQAWFTSYNQYILKYAAIAEKYKLPIFSVGTEMITASSHETEFRALITQVRKVYHGSVTYAANWGSKFQLTDAWNGEIDTIKWLDALDIVGVDAYYYLTDKQDPTKEDLITGWTPIAEHLADVAKESKKDIIFTEVGYRSIEGAAVHPGWWNGTLPVNVTQQALCYEAVFNVFSGQHWWQGAYWWNWFADPNAGGLRDDGYAPQNKPAINVLKKYYLNATKY